MSKFPSPVKKMVVSVKERTYSFWIPEREQFRLERIFFGKEYSIPEMYKPSDTMIMVDVGANIGIYAAYIKIHYPNSRLFCFEPVPSSLELLRKNTADFSGITIFPIALSNNNRVAKINLHRYNTGENSLKRSHDNYLGNLDIDVKDANTQFLEMNLNFIDVLKIDTEGCEVEILKSLQPRLKYTGCILLEYHSEKDRRKIDQLLPNFKLYGAYSNIPDLGIVKYINQLLLK